MSKHLSSILATFTILLAGCQPTTVAKQDARDRENPLIRNALEREESGDLDGAIQTCEEALLETPKLASAHFHLALWLQDYREDYISAIYHYRQYEKLRPNSEKQELIRDRIRVCKQSLAAQMLSNSDVAISRKQLELVSEIGKLNKRLSLVEGEKSALMEQRDLLERQLAEQKAESERLRRQLDRVIPASSTDETRSHSALPRFGSDPSSIAPTPATTRPTTTETTPEPAAAKSAAPDTATEPPPPGRPASTPAVTGQPNTPPPAPAILRTYVVQPGDSVYRIAERVYGDPEQWKKIRDANKDHLGPNNQVRVGQVLLIP